MRIKKFFSKFFSKFFNNLVFYFWVNLPNTRKYSKKAKMRNIFVRKNVRKNGKLLTEFQFMCFHNDKIQSFNGVVK